jgi:hypothetical protein
VAEPTLPLPRVALTLLGHVAHLLANGASPGYVVIAPHADRRAEHSARAARPLLRSLGEQIVLVVDRFEVKHREAARPVLADWARTGGTTALSVAAHVASNQSLRSMHQIPVPAWPET